MNIRVCSKTFVTSLFLAKFSLIPDFFVKFRKIFEKIKFSKNKNEDENVDLQIHNISKIIEYNFRILTFWKAPTQLYRFLGHGPIFIAKITHIDGLIAVYSTF